MSKQLKPCPFCGGKASVCLFSVSCEDCNATTGPETYDTMADDAPWVTAWNTRPIPDEVLDRVANKIHDIVLIEICGCETDKHSRDSQQWYKPIKSILTNELGQ